MRTILWGVCGIGLGHSYRQWPLIDSFTDNTRIVVFAYGSSLEFFREKARSHPRLEVIEVAVPYLPGVPGGLDFARAARLAERLDPAANLRALARLDELGGAQLCVSDYEPVSAQAAYAWNVPLLTIDQQSKFLNSAQREAADEVMRLRLFFPRAEGRLAASFFQTATGPVRIIAPILRAEIEALRRRPDPELVLVYISQQRCEQTDLPHLLGTLDRLESRRFTVFLPPTLALDGLPAPANVIVHRHGESPSAFMDALARCGALVSTAGHTLLSEAMHLRIPTYCLPLALYEQQLAARVIAEHGFGVRSERLELDLLRRFLADQELHRERIGRDRRILMRGSGREQALDAIGALLTMS